VHFFIFKSAAVLSNVDLIYTSLVIQWRSNFCCIHSTCCWRKKSLDTSSSKF